MGSVAVTFKETSCAKIQGEDEKMLDELKHRMSEGMVEGAKQQAAHLWDSVKKEKVVELVAEKVASSEINLFGLSAFPTDRSQVNAFLAFFSVFFFILAILTVYFTGPHDSTPHRGEEEEEEGEEKDLDHRDYRSL